MTLELNVYYLFIYVSLTTLSVVEAITFLDPVCRVNILAEQVQFSRLLKHFLSHLPVALYSVEPTTGTLSCSVILGPRTSQSVDIYSILKS
jgi:hypothetical protein